MKNKRNKLAILIVSSMLASSATAGIIKRIAIGAAVVGGGALIAKKLHDNKTSEVSFTFDGKVIAIDDGDTVKMLVNGTEKNIRLTDIDAPESNHGINRPSQPFSQASKKSLAALVLNRNVTAQCYDTDKYQRSVCRLIVDGVDANLEQIRRGMAWANLADKRSVRNKEAYSLHDAARSQRIGLWQEAGPIEPWKWRDACWKGQQCAGSGN